jgi:hypothetical protein
MGNSVNDTENEKTIVEMSKVQRVTAWIIGALVGQYSGIYFFFPLIGSMLVWFASNKFLSSEKKVVVPSLSWNAGHALWIVLGGIVSGQVGDVWLDLIFYTIGLLWLLAKPSTGPLYLLGIYQIFAILINLDSFVESAFRSPNSKALFVHLIWRAAAIFYMVKLTNSFRKTTQKLGN